jgi:hypothetical protein
MNSLAVFVRGEFPKGCPQHLPAEIAFQSSAETASAVQLQ